MKKPPLITIILVIALSSAVFILWKPKDKDYQAKKIISMVNDYQREHGKLPSGLEEVGIKETMDGPIFYQKENDSEFTVWYGTTLGESKIYRIKDGKVK